MGIARIVQIHPRAWTAAQRSGVTSCVLRLKGTLFGQNRSANTLACGIGKRLPVFSVSIARAALALSNPLH